MALPFFYIETSDPAQTLITLNEDTSKHVVQVLRMQVGDQLNLTDGKGQLLTAQITEAHKKNCEVKVFKHSYQPPSSRKITLAVSLVKNASRFEWFLEKATEIGIAEIIPLVCERTERQHFRYDRMKGIVVSAMLQSQQSWMPMLQEPVKMEQLKTMPFQNAVKLIAHCEETEKNALSDISISANSDCIILIGPEGDFTPGEIAFAVAEGYQPVQLGTTRLRTETAAVVAAALLNIR